jgi:hypothetical protein
MTIRSDLELPELEPAGRREADLVFQKTELARAMPAEEDVRLERDAGGVYIGLGGIGNCLIRHAGLVEYDPLPDADPIYVGLGLLGSVLATVLQLRGYLTLHASGVEIAGGGAIFVGDKGFGKSTTSAAFVRAGHRLIADDVIPIDLSAPDAPVMLPGYPQIKLSTAARDSVALPGAVSTPLGDDEFYKNCLRLAGNFSAQTASPAVTYVLATGPEFEILPLGGAQALGAVLVNSYHARYGKAYFHGATAAAHLRQCAALIGKVPVRRLVIPRDLASNMIYVRISDRRKDFFFVNKKEAKKTLALGVWVLKPARDRGAKVFWFFFSKKNILS